MHISTMLVFWSLARNSVVLAVYFLFSVTCFFTVHEHSGRKYSDIFKVLSSEDLQKMYYTLHEADITKFVAIVDSKIKEYFPETNLKRIRTAYGFTQAELAERSGVSLRSIQLCSL